MSVKTVGASEVEPLLPGMTADDLDVKLDLGQWFGFSDQDRLVGVVHLIPFDTDIVLDDVWTHPAFRKRGIASELITFVLLQAPRLWLICDEPDIGFYERRGFQLTQGLPASIAAHYAAKDEWPRALDHAHFAMVSEARGR
ncbi:MAG: GNAT family N-acetyltransferase [Actinomycetota bacterium]